MKTEKIELIENLLKKSAIQTIGMFRVNWGNYRLYATDNPIKLYCGITGALECITFKGNKENRQLDGWRKTMIDSFGRQQQEAYVNSTADFGTLCHQALLRIWMDGKLNWNDEQEYAHNYFKESAIANNLIPNDNIIEKQVFEYCKAAASLMQFVYEQVDEIYAIEGMCKSDLYQIATPVDLMCRLKSGKSATINIKTSSQLNDKHREQVTLENYLWNQTYPAAFANYTGLLRFKDWNIKKVPTYEFEMFQPEEKQIKNILTRLELAMNSENDTYLRVPKEVMVFTGETEAGQPPKIEVRKIEDVIFEPLKELTT